MGSLWVRPYSSVCSGSEGVARVGMVWFWPEEFLGNVSRGRSKKLWEGYGSNTELLETAKGGNKSPLKSIEPQWYLVLIAVVCRGPLESAVGADGYTLACWRCPETRISLN